MLKIPSSSYICNNYAIMHAYRRSFAHIRVMQSVRSAMSAAESDHRAITELFISQPLRSEPIPSLSPGCNSKIVRTSLATWNNHFSSLSLRLLKTQW